MSTTLDSRLMKAADALIHHGEVLEVVYIGPGVRRVCRLLGRGEREDTVRLGIWSLTTGIRIANRDVAFRECEPLRHTLHRLETVARFQESSPEQQEEERLRAQAFIEAVQRQNERRAKKLRGTRRDRLGRFQGGTHCQERA